MIGTKILGHLKGNRVGRRRINHLDKLDNGFQYRCYLVILKTEEVGQQTILLGTEQEQNIKQMRLLSAKVNYMSAAVVHDKHHPVVAFGIALLNPFRCRVALFLNDNGAWRKRIIEFQVAFIIFKSTP